MHTSPEDLALLALGEPIGTPETHTHLATCPVCRAELEEFSRAVTAARQSDPGDVLTEPSPMVWQRIQAEIASLPTATADTAAADTPAADTAAAVRTAPVSARASGGRRRLALALAAALVLVAGVGIGFGAGRLTRPAPAAAAQVHLNALPSWPGAEGVAQVKKDAQGDRLLVVQVSVPKPVQGRMEVWLSDEKSMHMMSMGYLSGDAGSFPIPAAVDLTKSPVIDVSVEPTKDPDPVHHSGVSLVRGRLVR